MTKFAEDDACFEANASTHLGLRIKKINNYYNPDDFNHLLKLENYIKAFKLCRKRTAWKKSIQKFWYNLLPNIYEIIEKLQNRKYKLAKPDEFKINERGKIRFIRSVPIEERLPVKILCQHIISPILIKQLIYHNSACIKNKGTLFSKKELKKHLVDYYKKHGQKGHVLTIDFSKYFENIDHKILFDKLYKYYKNEDIRWFLHLIIDSFGEKGLALGSELSQLLSTWYPNKLDHYIKEKLHIKYYGRYMDDLYLIHHDLNYLKFCLEEIKKICDELKIIINDKKTKFHTTKQGFIFLKCHFSILPTGRILVKPSRKNTIRIKRKLKKFKILYDKGKITYKDIRNTYESWKGHMKWTDCFHTLKNVEKFYLELFGLDKEQKECYYKKYKKKNKKGISI